jgi:tetratricopeptide (TPR) repeat protein
LVGTLEIVFQQFALVEGRRWLGVARALVGEGTPASVIARLDVMESHLAMSFGELKASLASAERAAARYRELGDEWMLARAQNLAVSNLVYLGRISEAGPLLKSTLALARRLGNRRLTAALLRRTAWASAGNGDIAGARAGSAEARAIYESLGADHAVALVLTQLADIEFLAGDTELALDYANEALAALRSQNDNDIDNVLSTISTYLIALGRYDEAAEIAPSSVEIARDQQRAFVIAFALQHLAALRPHAIEQGASAARGRAARIIGFVDSRLSILGAPREFKMRQEYDRLLATLHDGLRQDELASLLTAGATMTEDHAINEALLE